MATYGFASQNGANEIQVDGTYRNFSRMSTGTATTISFNTNVVNLCGVEVALPNLVNMPLIGTRPSTVPSSIFTYKRSGSYIVAFRLFSYNQVTSVPYAVYYHGLNGTKQNYGLEVRNASNQMVFNSWSYPLKIAGVYTATPILSGLDNSVYRDITVSNANSNYFILMPYNSDPYFVNVGPIVQFNGVTFFYMIAAYAPTLKYINSNTIRVQINIISASSTQGNVAPRYNFYYSPTVNIIEVPA